MDVVYLIHENGAVSVPLYKYDCALVSGLNSLRSGFWDKARNSFIFPCGISRAAMSRVFKGRVYVEAAQSVLRPVVVNGFFEGGAWASYKDSLNKSSASEDYFCGEWREKLLVEMHARKYSARTIKSYVHFNRAFCSFVKKFPNQITSADVSAYAAHLDRTFNFSASTMNMAISAIKFFYHQVMMNGDLDAPRRPRSCKKLPPVLGKDEIEKLLCAEENLKHRLLLMITYSSGLRVSETVALKRSDIDFARRVLFIRSAKGRKDRYVMLSDRAARFCAELGIHEKKDGWLFPGAHINDHLAIRSAQKVFERARQKSGVAKDVSIHALRHAFATHLLENGTDIRYIKELLGHSSIRTTERYTHVARKNTLKIASPFDEKSS